MQVCNSDAGVHSGFHGFLGSTPQVAALFQTIRRLAVTEWPVILLGETGSGKELLAEAIHEESPRADRPFIAVNCGALSPELAASELFGHVAGAFTSAERDRRGAFASAAGGTLFLDEIGDLPAEVQALLLRVLEARVYSPVGSSDLIPTDVRIVTATHRDLTKGFRPDLYHRLATFVLLVPALRDRVADIPLIAQVLLEELAPELKFESGAIDALCAHAWPGNVRELRNVLRRLSCLADGPIITTEALMLQSPAEVASIEAEKSKDQVELGILRRALWAGRGTSVGAAKILGCDETTFRRRSKRAGFSVRAEKKRYRYAQFQRLLNELDANGRNLAAAARALGINGSTARNWLIQAEAEVKGALLGTLGDKQAAAAALDLSIVEFGALERGLTTVGRVSCA